MNRLFKNFKKLSAKQIKTYAAVVLISALSFEAIALSTEEEPIPQPGMMDIFETSPIEELSLENWMLSPFEVIIDESSAIEPFMPAPSVELFETELALESWMALPFEISISEGSELDNNICSPAP